MLLVHVGERLNVGFSTVLALVALAYSSNRHSFAVDRGIHKDLFLRAVPVADHKPAVGAARRSNGVFTGDQIELIILFNVGNVPVR